MTAQHTTSAAAALAHAASPGHPLLEALVLRAPNGSPNTGPELASVGSIHQNLAEFSRAWLSR